MIRRNFNMTLEDMKEKLLKTSSIDMVTADEILLDVWRSRLALIDDQIDNLQLERQAVTAIMGDFERAMERNKHKPQVRAGKEDVE